MLWRPARAPRAARRSGAAAGALGEPFETIAGRAARRLARRGGAHPRKCLEKKGMKFLRRPRDRLCHGLSSAIARAADPGRADRPVRPAARCGARKCPLGCSRAARPERVARGREGRAARRARRSVRTIAAVLAAARELRAASRAPRHAQDLRRRGDGARAAAVPPRAPPALRFEGACAHVSRARRARKREARQRGRASWLELQLRALRQRGRPPRALAPKLLVPPDERAARRAGAQVANAACARPRRPADGAPRRLLQAAGGGDEGKPPATERANDLVVRCAERGACRGTAARVGKPDCATKVNSHDESAGSTATPAGQLSLSSRTPGEKECLACKATSYPRACERHS
jgi:hypothetical protein